MCLCQSPVGDSCPLPGTYFLRSSYLLLSLCELLNSTILNILFLLFTIRAKPIERKLRTNDLITRSFFQPPYSCMVNFQISINNLIAVHTNQMWMGMGSIAIVMTVITQVNLQYLTHFLEQGQGFVNRSMTHGRKSGFDFFVELGRARMSFAH